jgi:hypothetical protein
MCRIRHFRRFPFILSRIVLGKNSILIIKNSAGDVVNEYSGGTDGIEFN